MSACRARTVLATRASSSAGSPWASSGVVPACRCPPLSQSVGHKDGRCSGPVGQGQSTCGSSARPHRAGLAEHPLALPGELTGSLPARGLLCPHRSHSRQSQARSAQTRSPCPRHQPAPGLSPGTRATNPPPSRSPRLTQHRQGAERQARHLPCAAASLPGPGPSGGPAPTRLQPGKQPGTPGRERRAGRGSLPAPSAPGMAQHGSVGHVTS